MYSYLAVNLNTVKVTVSFDYGLYTMDYNSSSLAWYISKLNEI